MDFFKDKLIYCDYWSNYPNKNTCRHSLSKYKDIYRPCVYAQDFDKRMEIHPCPHFKGTIFIKNSLYDKGTYDEYRIIQEGGPLLKIDTRKLG